jgi:hypothetical protein
MRRGSVKKIARVQKLDAFVDWTKFCEAVEDQNVLTGAKLNQA